MGFAMFGLDVPTTKTTSALLCLTEDAVEDASQNATACINCGRCVEACPSRIVPSRLADYAEKHLEEPFEQWHVEAAALHVLQREILHSRLNP